MDTALGVKSLAISEDIPSDLGNGNDRSQKIRMGIKISYMRQRQFGDFRILPGKKRNHPGTWHLEWIANFHQVEIPVV